MRPTNRRIPIPPAVRTAVRLRSGNHCEDCGTPASLSRLEMHHLRYTYSPWEHTNHPRWNLEQHPIFGAETPDDLAHLCRTCHHNRHIDPAGNFWTDPEEMEAFWDSYYNTA